MRGDEVADDFELELARNLGLDLPLARATKEQYDRMIAEGLDDRDKSESPNLRSKSAITILAIAFSDGRSLLRKPYDFRLRRQSWFTRCVCYNPAYEPPRRA